MYILHIPLTTYPLEKFHTKQFDNILDCIDYIQLILTDKIEDDWNCHIDETIVLHRVLQSGIEGIEFDEGYVEKYNLKAMTNFVFKYYVNIQDRLQKNFKLLEQLMYSDILNSKHLEHTVFKLNTQVDNLTKLTTKQSESTNKISKQFVQIILSLKENEIGDTFTISKQKLEEIVS